MNTHPPIERIDLNALEPREKNPNSMAPEQFSMLVSAIKRVGFLQPLLVRVLDLDGRHYEIVDGVHRWRAAREAGLASVDCVVVDSDDAEAAALQIGMNRLRGELDLAKVAAALGELQADGWTIAEMGLTGFDLGEATDLLKTLGTTDEEMPTGATRGRPDEDAEEQGGPETFALEVLFATAKARSKARRALSTRGGGDLGVGLLALIAEVD